MAPTKAQQSGFCGERTSSGVNEPWLLCRGERYGACEDDVGADIIRPGRGGGAPTHLKKGGLGGYPILDNPRRLGIIKIGHHDNGCGPVSVSLRD